MAGPRHALILRSKGQRSKVKGQRSNPNPNPSLGLRLAVKGKRLERLSIDTTAHFLQLCQHPSRNFVHRHGNPIATPKGKGKWTVVNSPIPQSSGPLRRGSPGLAPRNTFGQNPAFRFKNSFCYLLRKCAPQRWKETSATHYPNNQNQCYDLSGIIGVSEL